MGGNFKSWRLLWLAALLAASQFHKAGGQKDSPFSPDADTHLPTWSPTLPPTPGPSWLPTAEPSFTYRPSLLPTVSSAPTTSLAPTWSPTRLPSLAPTHLPSTTLAPTYTTAPTMPTLSPSATPTTAEPTQTPTLAPTTELVMFSQRLAIGVSFILIVIAYAIHSITKPSELGQRGLDHRLYRIRDYRVEKRWGCRYCGYTRNVASSAECMQCGTNQLGEAEILPAHTARGFAAEQWSVRSMALGESTSSSKKNNGSNHGSSSSSSSSSVGSEGSGEKGKATMKAKPTPKVATTVSKVRLAVYGEVEQAAEVQRLVVWLRPDWPYTLSHHAHHHHAATPDQPHSSSSGGGSSTGVSGQSEELAHVHQHQQQHQGRHRSPVVCAGSGQSVSFAGAKNTDAGDSEMPTALALAELGFLVAERGRSGADLGCALPPSGHGAVPGSLSSIAMNGGGRRAEWGTARFRYAPTAHELQGLHLEWLPAQGGVAASPNLPPELLHEVEQTRKCFFPEKVAWLHDKLRLLQSANAHEVVPTEFATAYPASVLRDSIGFLHKVSPLQCLLSKYKIQFAVARSHAAALESEGEAEEKWLAALCEQFTDPACGCLQQADDGGLDLAPRPRSQAAAQARAKAKAKANRRRKGASQYDTEPESESSEHASEEADESARMVLFTSLGRAIAMALVTRAFVPLHLSRALCKLLVGQPLTFLDLLGSHQDLFQDLLQLMMLPPSAVAALNLTMPPTSTSGGEAGPRNASRDGVKWPGRGARAGAAVSANNRLEYVYRKMEQQLFLRIRPEVAAVQRALFEVIPPELLSVFDHREFAMLLNGHHAIAGSQREVPVAL